MRKLVCLAMLFLLLSAAHAEWVKVLVHVHQQKYNGFYDDGYSSQADVIAKAKKLGFQAIVMTPHYRADAHKTEPSDQSDMIVIDGAEMATYWGKDLVSHLLVVGDFYGDDGVNQLANHYQTQQKLIDRLNELNLITVAAHPNLISIVNQDLYKGKPASFIFNVAEAKGLKGKEVFNDGDAYAKTIENLIMDMERGNQLLVTAGCDSHDVKIDTEDAIRWTRATWVWVDGAVNKESILESMRLGQTYAAQYGAAIKDMNFIPKKEAYQITDPDIQFTVAFPKPVASKKKINVYFSNGEVIKSVMNAGQSECRLSLMGPVDLEEISFFIEVEECLVTSPINLTKKKAEATLPETGADLSIANLPKLTTYRYREVGYNKYTEIPESKIEDAAMNNSWFLDETKWQKGRTALLLPGLSVLNPGKCRKGLTGLAQYLNNARMVGATVVSGYDNIYIVECPPGFHIAETAASVKALVYNRMENLPPEEKIDIFAYSMGGLVARTALETKINGQPPLSNRVAHLVMLGTPQTGFKEIEWFKQYLGDLPEINDMNPNEPFLNGFLNLVSSQRPKSTTDYYALVGLRSYRPNIYGSDKIGVGANLFKKLRDESAQVHDGLVEVDSAKFDLSLFCRSYKKAEFDLNHEYIKNHQEIFDAIDRWIIADKWFLNEPLPQFTSGIPMFIGKNYREVQNALGRVPDEVVTASDFKFRFVWNYNNFIMNRGKLSLHFENLFDSTDRKTDLVRWVFYEYKPEMTFTNDAPFPPLTSVVPRELLKIKPYLIARDRYSNNLIIVIWRLSGKTFVLHVGDSKRKLIEKTRSVNASGLLVDSYSLTAAGRHFELCNQPFRFMYVDYQPKLYNLPIGYPNEGGVGDSVLNHISYTLFDQ